ncbi:MAG TPA: DUF192 domain-containing protein [Bryobacteraceae bacterium]|jgi:uncharacterized membrane protein (UPF0127 family)|nr:DUF192 domain-containing protein [Bryobacteraceae bacterium]
MEPAREYTVLNQDRGSAVAKRVRIAGTSRARRDGLLNVSELDAEAGLWIAPCEAVHTFGMRMPIDVLFLDREFRVRKVRYALKPRRLAVCLRADSVLELAAGAVARSATSLGDRLKFSVIACG